jgi:hypothetical protein
MQGFVYKCFPTASGA